MTDPSQITARTQQLFRETENRAPYNPNDEENVSGRIVVITGANSGIGAEAAIELAKRGAVVVMACRDMAKGLKVTERIKLAVPNSQTELIELDLGDLSSVRKCAVAIRNKYDHVHILINNAAVVFDETVIRTTKDGFERHLGINHLGHFLFTKLLLDLLKKGAPSRIVNVSSGNFAWGQLDFDDLLFEKTAITEATKFAPYARSKLANVLFTRALAKRLAGTGVTTYALCPGHVKTDIMRNCSNFPPIDPKYVLTSKQGAEGILFCALSKTCAHESGEMYRFGIKPWQDLIATWDESVEEILFKKSEELVA